MSKKWNIFRKKVSKTDSHGTTACDEELQFQPGPLHRNEQVTRLSAVQAQHNLDLTDHDTPKAQSQDFPLHDRVVRSERRLEKERSKNGVPGVGEIDERISERMSHLNTKDEIGENSQGGANNILNNSKVTPNLRPDPIPKQRTLLKPGGAPAQQAFVPPGKDVSISDEYSDPFDALQQKALAKKTTDGYVEPYKAQKIYHDVTHGSGGEAESDAGSAGDNYQDPWDKRNEISMTSNHAMEYEDPWDQSRDTATLPYGSQKWNGGVASELARRHQAQQKNGEHGLVHNDSWDSGASSASSASPNVSTRHRLVRVERPRLSPRSSPHFDRRLILPKDAGYGDNYSEPWGRQVKFKPVDKRLIKAEPSLEELRRMSPGGHSSTGTASPLSSGRGSPDQLVSHASLEALARSGETRRASSPIVSGNAPSGLHQYMISMNKTKSKSLDMRNPRVLAALAAQGRPAGKLPKSASDDQLVNVLAQGAARDSASNPYLHGVGEYEEPWEKSGVLAGANQNAVYHIRSRSYELQGQSLQPFDPNRASWQRKRNVEMPADGSLYDSPWDAPPTNHLQSMQRFQERKLELHPAEAIVTRDFDPLLPLERQLWFHEGITRDDAEARLRDKAEGSYLVRKSESAKNSFSLSVQSSNGCIHMLLRRTRDGSWILGEFSAPFLSAPEMVAYYTRNKLKISDAEYVTLSYPVPDPHL